MRRGAWFLSVLGAACLLSSLIVITASASTAVVASFGVRGAAKVTSGGPNTVYVNLKNLPNGTWTEVLYKGTCATVGVRILTLPSLRVTGGLVRRTNTVSLSQARSAAAGVIRITRGATVYCARFASLPTPSRSPGAGSPKPSPTASASPKPSPSVSASPTGSPTQTASPTGTPGSTSGTCTFDGTYVCVGDTLAVVYDDGKDGTLTVESALRSAANASGMVTLDVLLRVNGPAGEDVTYNWMVGDIGGQAPTFGPQAGAPSPAYPSKTDGTGVARGWLRFLIPANYKPFMTTPGGASVRLT